MHPSRLAVVRSERQKRGNFPEALAYADQNQIRRETNDAQRLFAAHSWLVIDVTFKSVEEVATEIMRVMYARLGLKKATAVGEAAVT